MCVCVCVCVYKYIYIYVCVCVYISTGLKVENSHLLSVIYCIFQKKNILDQS